MPSRIVSLVKEDATPPVAVASALRTLASEQAALRALVDRFEEAAFSASFVAAAELIIRSTGRLILTGMGKSGLVARKIAATMTSTGTPSFYLHAAEAGHGDLGMVTARDVVMAFSWSGETSDLSDILNYCHRFDVPVIGITSRPRSTLAAHATLRVILPAVSEACPHHLAPTSSTIVQAAFGDALAVALIEARGFSPDDFRRFHPKGHLGSRLLTVGAVMATGDAVPRVEADASVSDAMLEMSRKRFGITAIVDEDGRVLGAFTDGDLRRALERGMGGTVRDYMTAEPIAVGPDALVSEVLARMNKHNISQIFVIENGRLTGVVHIHDVLRTGVV